MSDILAFTERFFDAVARHDIDAVAAVYRDDIKVWHNWDTVEQTKAENLATLGSIPQRYDSFGYVDVRCVPVEGGFLRQHTIKASLGGKTALVPAIMRGYVEDGLIYRLEEYFDRGQLISALS